MPLLVHIEIGNRIIADVMCTMLESGGSDYWCREIRLAARGVAAWNDPDIAHMWKGAKLWYESPEFLLEPWLLIDIHEIEGPTDKWHQVGRTKFRDGFKKLLEKEPKHFCRIITGDYDMNTTDALLQCMVFGEIKYG